MSHKPKIATIDGKSVSRSLSDVAVVHVPSPSNRSELVKVTFSEDLIVSMARGGWQTELMQIWPLIHGKKPPINAIGFHEKDQGDVSLIGLTKANALFSSLQRPCNSHEKGEDVLVYVVGAEYTYEYIPHMVCVGRRVPLPACVLTAYVRFYDSWNDLPSEDIKGEIIGWDLVKTSEDDKTLPLDYKTRYNQRIW